MPTNDASDDRITKLEIQITKTETGLKGITFDHDFF
jgi:hypothetical protein